MSKNVWLQWLHENEWTCRSARIAPDLSFPIWPSQTITAHVIVPLGQQTNTGRCSLVLRSHPACDHLQYRQVGKAWYLFSHEHDKIKTNRLCCAYCSTDYMLNAWRSPTARQDTCCKLSSTPWLFLLFWGRWTHAQLKSFLPSFLSCRHRALSCFSAIEAGQIPGTRLGLWLPCNLGTRPSKTLKGLGTRLQAC